MNITCPQCGFSREIAPEKLPKGAAIATCPKCSCRFRLSSKGAGEILPPDGWKAMPKEEPKEETEDLRAIANKAYQEEARRFDQHEAPTSALPWLEAPEKLGWLAAFYQTVIRVMFQAPAFFRALPSQGAWQRPFLFYMIICVIQTVTERLWASFFRSALAPGAAEDPQLERLLTMLAPDDNFALALLLRCAILALQLYFFSFLMYLVYRYLKPKRATFILVFQIMAYSSAPSLLCIIPAIGSLAGTLWGFACLLIGCKSALNLDWPRTLAGFAPLALLFIPLLAQIMNAAAQ